MNTTTAKTLTLYSRLQAAGVTCDHWQSDLYFPVNSQTTDIVRSAFLLGEIRNHPTTFTCKVTKALFYDAAFQYTPSWEGAACEFDRTHPRR